jgi:hypothetical protein
MDEQQRAAVDNPGLDLAMDNDMRDSVEAPRLDSATASFKELSDLLRDQLSSMALTPAMLRGQGGGPKVHERKPRKAKPDRSKIKAARSKIKAARKQNSRRKG